MSPGHYVFVRTSRRARFLLFDSPVANNVPWISGPELGHSAVTESVGPHSGGFFYVDGSQHAVSFMLNHRRFR